VRFGVFMRVGATSKKVVINLSSTL
jgi:uncharacterized membrane protein YqaE (UPF0057 family)